MAVSFRKLTVNEICDTKDYSPEEQMDMVVRDPVNLRWITNPTDEAIDYAVSKNGHTLYYVKNPSKEIKEMAIKNSPTAIYHIKNPDEDLVFKAIRKNPQAIKYIAKSSEDAQMYVVMKNPEYIRYIKNPTEKTELYVIKNPHVFLSHKFYNYISCKHENSQLELLKADIFNLAHIKKPTLKVQFTIAENIPKINHSSYRILFNYLVSNAYTENAVLHKILNMAKNDNEIKDIKSHKNYTPLATLIQDAIDEANNG